MKQSSPQLFFKTKEFSSTEYGHALQTACKMTKYVMVLQCMQCCFLCFNCFPVSDFNLIGIANVNSRSQQ